MQARINWPESQINEACSEIIETLPVVLKYSKCFKYNLI